MNEHAGPACALSVLIVGVFAVLLHEKLPTDPPTSPRPQPTARAVNDAPLGPPAQPLPRPAAEPPSLPPKASIASTNQIDPSRPAPAPPRALMPPAVVERPDRTSPSPPAPKAESRPRRAVSSFTEVEAGETLADVAMRVYGSAEMAHALWKANRDLLDRPTSNLARGMLLRTP